MTIAPGGEIGEEIHDVDQILTFVGGVGKAVVSGQIRRVSQGTWLSFLPATNIISRTKAPNPLVLYTVYGPP